jgi:hypothetical protein
MHPSGMPNKGFVTVVILCGLAIGSMCTYRAGITPLSSSLTTSYPVVQVYQKNDTIISASAKFPVNTMSPTASENATGKKRKKDRPKAPSKFAVPDIPPPERIHIQFPVFVASLYKSGTVTTHNYFTCGKQRALHHHLGSKYKLGSCLMDKVNVSEENPKSFYIAIQ